ncbi:cytochrome P450 20A1-like [Lingula anatina]|uniref:Cytochrome P450 20A1-like n=1 Tax=Lingula anatina TaxID=7574 RepID=A0A1S3KGY9_LINAN|nr:cytochrome P450 20A1-like [Lingula anatina]|eukprot:XP_013421910.1 cytochrome P450 20A1-like [Lingula anatina]
MEERLTGDIPQPGSEREKKFNNANKYMKERLAAAIDLRRKAPTTEKREMLIDVLIENNIPDDMLQGELISFIIGGFHSSGNLLVWALHFISVYPVVQEKMFQEVKAVLGDTGKVTPDNIAQLVFIRQVMDETLRVAVVAPYAGRYDDEKDVKLGDYVIPAGTPILYALGVVLNDPTCWPNPKKYVILEL